MLLIRIERKLIFLPLTRSKLTWDVNLELRTPKTINNTMPKFCPVSLSVEAKTTTIRKSYLITSIGVQSSCDARGQRCDLSLLAPFHRCLGFRGVAILCARGQTIKYAPTVYP